MISMGKVFVDGRVVNNRAFILDASFFFGAITGIIIDTLATKIAGEGKDLFS
jgi:hypothetical protein